PARSVGRDQSGSTVRRGTSGGAACGGCGRGSPSSDGDRVAPEGSQERLGTAATSGARPGRVGRVLRRRGAEAGRRGGGAAQGRGRSPGGRNPPGRPGASVTGRGGP